jgi:hypothetical protein
VKTRQSIPEFISGSHGGEFEDGNVMNCCTVYSGWKFTDVSEVLAAAVIRAMSLSTFGHRVGTPWVVAHSENAAFGLAQGVHSHLSAINKAETFKTLLFSDLQQLYFPSTLKGVVSVYLISNTKPQTRKDNRTERNKRRK